MSITSYSQSGEDIIIDFIFDTLTYKERKYLDIGAHHPSYLSNTYLFYLKGFNGVCVEPDPTLFKVIKKERPNDKCLQVGIDNKNNKKAKFYIMDPPTLNTFSEKEVEVYKEYYPWSKVVKEVKVPLVNIKDIIAKYFKKGLDILSVDTEGLDLEIIKGIDLEVCRPKVICVETATYLDKNTLAKNHDVIKYLLDKDYFVYADTFINTIFVDKHFWKDNNGPKLERFNIYDK